MITDSSENQQRRLRVVQVIGGGLPSKDQPGRGIFNVRSTKRLLNVADVHVLQLRAWLPGRKRVASWVHEGVPIISLSMPYFGAAAPQATLVAFREIGWLSIRNLLLSCDVIHSVCCSVAGIVASNWARRAGRCHITQLTGADVNTDLPLLYGGAATANWTKYLYGVAANSHALANSFLSFYPKARNVRTIYRGVDLSNFSPLRHHAAPRASADETRYLFLGGFARYETTRYRENTKGGWTLLTAWRAAESEPNSAKATLWLGGPASNSDKVQAWRNSLAHPERVRILGSVEPKDVPSLMASCDCVLVPSMQEGLPNVAVESQAMSRAVFGSYTGGIPEVVKPKETGILLPRGAPRAWKDAIVAWAGRNDELRQLGEQGRARASVAFDALDYPARMLELYTAALATAKDYAPSDTSMPIQARPRSFRSQEH